MTEPKEIKLFDLKTDKRYDITAISKSDDVGPTNGLFFILEGNLKLYLSVVDLQTLQKLISYMSYMTLFHIFLIKNK
jgi:hypothetical protein